MDEARGESGAAAGAETGGLPSRRLPGQRGQEPHQPPSDADLLASVRGGDDSAFEELYRRHAEAVRRYARGCCRDAHTAEDLTGEVFARTLQAVRRGSGPDSAVRAYLLATVRRVAASWGNTSRREQLVEDFASFAGSATGSPGQDIASDPGADVRAMREAEGSLAVQAFRTLPERWQTVLWHTAVEEESPSQVAPLLGLTANATAVLAHRAREGLRRAYLQAHVSAALTAGGRCARYADRLGAHARGGLRMRADRELKRHLRECERCRAAALELADVNAALRGLLPVAVVGWFAAGHAGFVGAATKAAGIAAGTAGAGPSSGGPGGSAGGLGVAAKAGIAAVVASAAGMVFAFTLTGIHRPPPGPRAGSHVPVTQAVPVVPVVPSAPAAAPTGSPAPPGAAFALVPVPTPSPTGEQASRPEPSWSASSAPTPDPAPTPPPTPSPAPRVYEVGRLGWTGFGDDADPTLRLGRRSWVWDRQDVTVGGRRYADGITTPAPSSVFIDLNRGCTAYDALAGIDDLTPVTGAVRFAVLGDGVPVWRSQVVRSGDAAVPVHVPLAGVRTIQLVVEPAGPFPAGDLADWARPRISCR